MEELLLYVNTNKADLIIAFLAFLGAASAIAKLTPTEADNKVVDFLFKLINAFGLNK